MRFSENSLFVAPTPVKLAEELAGWFYSQVFNHSNASKKYYIALSGGTTPVLFFNYLASYYGKYIDWGRIHFFWADERCVPPDDNDSNYKTAFVNLLSKIEIPSAQIHRIRGESDPHKESVRYAEEIMSIVPLEDNVPRFDLILLGMGADGHTASLFPDQAELYDGNKLVAVTINPNTQQQRITLTPWIINRAAKIVFQVTGFAKAGIVGEILQQKPEASQYSASKIKPIHGDMYWFIDAGAAKELFK
ncbi:MAG: 6-phosphogluconolactonase [Bacteroidales bacterium]|nr:6-phosphogluconolactonase [Bacteroidales bacterium]